MDNVNSACCLLNNSCACELEFQPTDNFTSLANKSFSISKLKDVERIDRVSILAFHYKPLHHECVVLIKQYRPHLSNYTIEMPTGLVENNETPEISAVRILTEQTGYFGYVKTVGPRLADCPCSTSQFSRIISMRIDGNDVRNSSVTSRCTCDSNSKIILVPVEELLDKLIGFTECNYFIDSKIDAFAVGLVKGKLPRKNSLYNI